MATRHGERELAFQVLYGLSFGSVQTLEELQDIFYNSPGYPAKESTSTTPSGFAWELVEGVWKSATLLDDVIDRHSHNWRVNRMGRVELTLLRLAVYEMLCRDLRKEIDPSGHAYALTYEGHTEQTPKAFWEQRENDRELLGVEIYHQNVVEIDDGLAPVCFFKANKGYRVVTTFNTEVARNTKLRANTNLFIFWFVLRCLDLG